jgi:LacI family transcriptional regulator
MSRTARTNGLFAVARAAGVSPITVSRVLRDSPHVRPETRMRVLAAANEAGYRPNPHFAHLMSLVRAAKRRRAQAVIAIVRDDLIEDELHDPAYQYVRTEDIRSRAERHGYLVEEFFLGRRGLTPTRLRSILRARGIEGLIVSPQSSRIIGAEFDYSGFAAATFGYGLQTPALHRACTNMTQGIHGAVDQLTARGYHRIGLAVTQWIDARVDHAYSSALLYYQHRLPPRERVPLLVFPENNLLRGRDAFCRWVRRHKPDVIISFHRHVPDWLQEDLDLRVPEDIGLVVHDWAEPMRGFAGINHCRPFIAAAAVDLVATQLMQNERGVPAVPKQILVRPVWIEGASIRPPLAPNPAVTPRPQR